MPIGTEFEVVYDDGFKFDEGNKVKLEKCTSGSMLTWLNGEDVYCGNQFITATFIPIQKPVSFMEAIANPSNKIKVDINQLEYLDGTKEKLNKYMSIRQMFIMMEERFTNIGITDVINNGKWYIEESEADFND